MNAALNATEYCLRRLAPLLPALSSGLALVVVIVDVDEEDNEDNDKAEEEEAEEDDDDDDDDEKDDDGDGSDKYALGWDSRCEASAPALPHTMPHVRHVCKAVVDSGVTS